MRSLWLSWVLATLILAPVARADEYLIQEVSKVLKTLDAKDPSRPALTLHLADLYFDEASDMFRKETLNGKISAKIADFRQKALKGYYDVLYGFSGQFPKPEGERKYKVQFQIGRLHSDAGNVREALPIFEELAQQKKNSEIAREASLRAAEIYEARDGQPSFVKAKQYFEQGLSLAMRLFGIIS